MELKTYQTETGVWRWVVVARNGAEIGRSSKHFSTPGNARRNARSLYKALHAIKP